MKKILGVFAICLSFSAFAGNNDIYITQTGTGLTLTIDQIGTTNTVGTSVSRATLSGTSMIVDIDQIGDTNTWLASILQGNSSSWTYSVTGDSNSATLAVGGSGDAGGSDFDYTTVGDSNVLIWTQGANSTATSADTDFSISGTSNNINAACDSVGCINNWTISGNSNDIDTVQTGSANHSITVALTGTSNDIDVHQTDVTSTNVVNLISTTTGGTIDVDQCASGC